jgi:hypothetical protein
VIRIPMPPTYQASDPYYGTVTVFPTYTNSSILNKKVLVPVYNLPQDDAGLMVYKNFFTPKGMEVIGIDSREVIKWGGAVHCVTMERPKIATILPGDLNVDLTIGLTDAILALQVVSHIVPSETIYREADVNGDKRINIIEVIYILQNIAGMRP